MDGLRGRGRANDDGGLNEAWYEIVAGVLKRHKVDLVTYVPDNVLRPLIELIDADPFFTAFAVAREEEALGINAGAWMGGVDGILLMQTSGFATLAERAGVAVGAVPDPDADDGLRTRHAWASSISASHWWRAPCGRCWIRW